VKVTFGAADSATQVSPAAPLPVTLLSESLAGNLDVNLAASAATVTVTSAALAVVGGGAEATALRVTIATDSTGVLSVDDNAGSLTVDGVVTANAGTGTFATSDTATQVDDAAFAPGTGRVAMIGAEFDNVAVDSVDEGDGGALRMSANRNLYVNIRDAAGNERGLNVDAAGSIAVTSAALAVLGGGVEAAALRVTIANDSTGLLSIDDNGGSLTVDGTVAISNAAFGVVGGGVEATALRVTIATDSTGVLSIDDNGSTLTVDGTVAVSSITTAVVPGTAATNLGKAIDTLSGATDTGVGALAVRRDADTSLVGATGDWAPLLVDANGYLKVEIFDGGGSHTVDGAVTATAAGDIAHDAADSGNPVKVGAVARQTRPTAVADADRVNLFADDVGRLVNYPFAPRDLVVHNRLALTTTTETTLIAAIGANVFVDLLSLVFSNESAVETRVDIRDATAGTVRLSVDLAADGGGAVVNLPIPLTQATANNNWTAQLSGANATIYITALAISQL
jgi:hypothetical protein